MSVMIEHTISGCKCEMVQVECVPKSTAELPCIMQKCVPSHIHLGMNCDVLCIF